MIRPVRRLAALPAVLVALALAAAPAGADETTPPALDLPTLGPLTLDPLTLDPLTLDDVRIQAERDLPSACFTFSHDLHRPGAFDYRAHVAIAPAIDHALAVRGPDLCIEGLAHGESYAVTLRAGLPASEGAVLAETREITVEIPDRAPSVRFVGQGYVLPRIGAEGLPLRTINVERVRASILRIHDGNLIGQLRDGMVQQPLGRWQSERVEDQDGEEIWAGELVVRGEPNRAVTTALPLGETVGRLAPGIYVALAETPEARARPWEPFATQWFVVADIGLVTFQADDGLHVVARSLEDGRALPDIELRLMARNNKELGHVSTDAGGMARFDPGLLRGRGGNAPQALFAYGEDGEFVHLDLVSPGHDLSDRGVAGREPPGPLDAFLFTERGIYRPGESVHLFALLRDERAYAVTRIPLTLRITRPDGNEIARATLRPDAQGGYRHELPIPEAAFTGTWSASAHTDPDGPAIGEVAFLVDDFVPPRLELALAAPTAALAPGETLPLTVEARYLYGAPGAELGGEVDATLRRAQAPFLDHADWHFGLEQEGFSPVRLESVPFTTDGDGRAALVLDPGPLPDTTHPLTLGIEAVVFDIDGRPIARNLDVPLRNQPFAIGIRPDFALDSLPRGGTARFEIVALGPDGRPLARDDLRYELIEEQHDYVWYQAWGRWDYEIIVTDRALDGGGLELDATRPTRLELPVASGRYRMEVHDPESGVATSVRFQAGWWYEAEIEPRPDRVEVTLGEVADGMLHAFVKPPFAGEVLLALADRELRHIESVRIGIEGAEVTLPLEGGSAAGVYVMAIALAPADVGEAPLPRRAIGLAWHARAVDKRRLAVQIEAPEIARPQAPMSVAVEIDDTRPGEEVRLVVAAVDEAVLQVTDFHTPDPLAHHLGQQRLGLELRDLYGRLIDASGAETGILRSGGDTMRARQITGLPARSARVVALVSETVTLDQDGRAVLAFDLPDFNGRLRLMAVAWSATRLGSTEAATTVRAPVVAELALPRFLAPDDQAELVLAIDQLEGPDGAYHARIEANGPVTILDGVRDLGELAAGDSRRLRLQARALTAGVAAITLTVEGPDGFAIERGYDLAVRPAHPVITRRHVARLAPDSSLTLSPDLLAGMLPGTGRVALGIGSLPELDLPGLLAQLDRYPYGCAEQITSRALPLLYVGAIAERLGLADEAPAARIQDTIRRLLNLQTGGGSFAAWSPLSGPDLWLSAYVLDFLGRAREAGFAVATAPYQRALDWLDEAVMASGQEIEEQPGLAYGALVLARAGRLDLPSLRWLEGSLWRSMPTDLGRAQLAAALAFAGDPDRAGEALARLGEGRVTQASTRDYGSDLRDRAAILAVLAEADLLDHGAVLRHGQNLALRIGDAERLSTQEQAWLVMAAHTLIARAPAMDVEIDGLPEPTATGLYVRLDEDALARAPSVRNRGAAALFRTLTISGMPIEPQPAEAHGFRLTRSFWRLDGTPADLGAVRQNERLVVRIEGEALRPEERHALVVDLLPAGFEIENVRIGGSQVLADLDWLEDTSPTAFVEARDDRYVAALDPWHRRSAFRLAYLVRAITPGRFVLPGAFVEDMYRPDRFARGESGTVVVEGPRDQGPR